MHTTFVRSKWFFLTWQHIWTRVSRCCFLCSTLCQCTRKLAWVFAVKCVCVCSPVHMYAHGFRPINELQTKVAFTSFRPDLLRQFWHKNPSRFPNILNLHEHVLTCVLTRYTHAVELKRTCCNTLVVTAQSYFFFKFRALISGDRRFGTKKRSSHSLSCRKRPVKRNKKFKLGKIQ